MSHRILILGSSGSGKSTFARLLAEQLGSELIHLDSHYWRPNWVAISPDEWDQLLRELVERDSWVMDGNYSKSLDLRLAYADTVIFLDYHRLLCLWRCVGRYLRYRGRVRPELAPGCYEKLDWEFITWIWNYPRRSRPQVWAALERHAGEKRIYRLRGNREVAHFLTDLHASGTLPSHKS